MISIWQVFNLFYPILNSSWWRMGFVFPQSGEGASLNVLDVLVWPIVSNHSTQSCHNSLHFDTIYSFKDTQSHKLCSCCPLGFAKISRNDRISKQFILSCPNNRYWSGALWLMWEKQNADHTPLGLKHSFLCQVVGVTSRSFWANLEGKGVRTSFT